MTITKGNFRVVIFCAEFIFYTSKNCVKDGILLAIQMYENKFEGRTFNISFKFIHWIFQIKNNQNYAPHQKYDDHAF